MAALERRLSVERLVPYRLAADNNLARAIRLYEWNADIGAAFWASLGHVEVLLRNAMHTQLTRWSVGRHGDPRWYLDPDKLLSRPALADIDDARRRASRNGTPETPGRVVAELGFGFWRFLLASQYERTLWLPLLRHAFPGLRGRGIRRDVHNTVADLHGLRNRIAHQEPIHNRSLATLHQKAIQTANWICPVTRRWIETRCRVPALLDARP
jgi:hypothetical protein